MARKLGKANDSPDLKLADRIKAAKSKRSNAKVSLGKKRGVKTLAIWLVVAAAIAGISYVSHQEPAPDFEGAKRASSQILSDFQNGDCGIVYSNTTAEFQSRSTEENWNTQCASASEILQGDLELLSSDDTPTNAKQLTYTYRIAGTDDQDYVLTTVMVQQDDKSWKLDGLSSKVEQPEAEATPAPEPTSE